MPLKIVKSKDDPKKNEVVYVAGSPAKIGTKVPPSPRVEHEIDYDMHKVQQALVPVQTRLRSVT